MFLPLQRRSSRALVALICCTALFAGLNGPPAAGSEAGPEDCPELMPASELGRGMIATGYTVSQGRTPEPFSAEVLGVLPDGIGPGRDMIIVETSGPAIDKAKGIWFGMSGSPVYLEGKLIGALSFGLSWGPSSIAGLTPAREVAALLDFPTPSAASAEANSFRSPGKVKLSSRWVNRIASRTNTPANQVSNSMERLKTPLAVSGIGARGMTRLRRVVAREGLPFVPYISAKSSTSSTSAEGTVQAGDNFAAALSYGDVTLAGVGTTTMVCDDKIVAFGHPFFWDGRTKMGANAAEAITIVDDTLFGSYKLATIEEGVGTLDQDRLAGIRAITGSFPATIPITSNVVSVDDAQSREGKSEAVQSWAVPFLTFIHMFSNIDVTYDRIGAGSSLLSWKVTGTRASGGTWQLTRGNRFVSDFDISWASLFELDSQLYAIAFNRFENVEFTSVDVDATIEERVKTYSLVRVLAGSNRRPLRRRDTIRAKPGDRIRLRVRLASRDGSGHRLVNMRLRIPRRVRRGGFIEVGRLRGGGFFEEDFFFECFFFGDECGTGAQAAGNNPKGFDALLKSLQNKPRNDEVFARLRAGPGRRVLSKDSRLLNRVVRGRQRIGVIITN
jgi:hypothetical protein